MRLELSYEESLELLAALRVHVDELQRQLQLIDNADVRANLERSIGNLAAVLRRLDAAERQGVLYA